MKTIPDVILDVITCLCYHDGDDEDGSTDPIVHLHNFSLVLPDVKRAHFISYIVHCPNKCISHKLIRLCLNGFSAHPLFCLTK